MHKIMNTAIAYCRVSTKKQGIHGLSLDAQGEIVKTYAEQKGITLNKIFPKICSGKTYDVSSHLLSGTRFSEKIIIFTDISRFSRNYALGLEVAQKIMEADMSIHFISENLIVDRLTFAINGQIYTQLSEGLKRAEEECKEISDRVKRVINYKRKRGQYIGGSVPFGLQLVEENVTIGDGENTKIIKKYIFNQNELNIVKFVEKCRSTRYTGEKLTTLMNAISTYQDPIELVHKTITDYEDYEEVHKVNTKPMDFKDICYLLNDYEVQYRGKAFTVDRIKRIRPVNVLRQYVIDTSGGDINNLVEQLENLNVHENDNIDEGEIEDEKEESQPQRRAHKKAKRTPRVTEVPLQAPMPQQAPMPPLTPAFADMIEFAEDYQEFLEFKKFRALKNKK